MLTRKYHDHLFNLFDPWSFVPELRQNFPIIEESSDEKNSYIKLSVPGFNEKDLHVEVKNNTLKISGKVEKTDKFASNYLSFDKSLSIDSYHNADNISAEYKAGMLVITLPRKYPVQTEHRMIPISTSSNLLESG